MAKKWFGTLKKLFLRQKNHNKTIDFMELGSDEFSAWWGNFTVEEEQSRYIKVENLVICIDRFKHEWCIAFRKELDPLYPSKTVCIQSMSSDIAVKPVLADRSLLSALKFPLYIPGESEITFYASSPVSIQMCLQNGEILLEEIPTQILPDSWHGNTIEGELCYGGHPICLKLEELTLNTVQVITPITVYNYDKSTILLKEVTIPLPTLSIYQDEQNHLWTEQLLISNVGGFLSTTLLKNKESGLPSNLTLLSHPRCYIKPRFKGLFSR